MNTNRLSPTLAAALNKQLTKEAYSSQIYLSYAVWADGTGRTGLAQFLFRHAQEERKHMMKMLEYILQRGAKVIIDATPAPTEDPGGIYDCFEKIFTHEVDNTKAVNNITKMSFQENDWATCNFMQWFVDKQSEEELLLITILNKMKISCGKKIPTMLYIPSTGILKILPTRREQYWT